MGRRLVVTVVLDEGRGGDLFDQLAQVVCAARGVVRWQVEDQDHFGRPLKAAHAALSRAWAALDGVRDAGGHWDACADYVAMAIERVEQADASLTAARQEDEFEAVGA